jgi:hypothetical protein
VIVADEVGALVALFLFAYSLLDVLRTPSQQCRNLPKPVWLVLCVFPLVLGPLSWLIFGRPVGPQQNLPYKGNRGIPPEYDRPGRATAFHPDDDAAFLKQLRDRAEEQRRAAEEAKRREEPS